MANKSERIAGLDLVRAIAVLSVVGAHSFTILSPLFTLPYIGRALSFMGDHIRPFAGLGVELFFALSGFLIGNILIRIFVQADDFSFTHVKQFWIRRWFRTLPNYWLLLIVNLILYAILHLQPVVLKQVLYFFFLQNLIHPVPLDFFIESWSLSVEEWFYLTLPIAIYISSRFFTIKNKGRFLLKVFIGYLIVFLIIRCINAPNPINGPDQDEGIRKVVLFRLDAVMYGVLLAWLNTFKSEALYRFRKRLLAISIVGSAVLYFLVSKRSLQISNSDIPAVRFASNAFLFVLQPMFLALCLPYANSIKTFASLLFQRAASFISRISYSLYLVHYSLIFLPFFFPLRLTSPWAAIGMYLLYWMIVIGLSSAIYKYFEYPIMNRRDKVKTGKR